MARCSIVVVCVITQVVQNWFKEISSPSRSSRLVDFDCLYRIGEHGSIRLVFSLSFPGDVKFEGSIQDPTWGGAMWPVVALLWFVL